MSSASLSDDRANISNPVPMIYQSGYLTIKSYDQRFRVYILGFPNEEVKYGFLNFAAPFYTPVSSTDTSFYIGKFVRELFSGRKLGYFPYPHAGFWSDVPYELLIFISAPTVPMKNLNQNHRCANQKRNDSVD